MFLSEQGKHKLQPSVPPTPEKTLSLNFLVDDSKNLRLSVDVNMTLKHILGEMGVHEPADPRDLELHIAQNAQPMVERVVVTADCMHKTFWDLVLEFGVLCLLSFSVTTRASECADKSGSMDALQVQLTPHKKSSIFKRFKSKKGVSK